MEEFKKLGFLEKMYYDFPNIINLEVYRGMCPCECVHCPVGKVEVKDRAERFGVNAVSMELFKKVVDEISDWTHSTIRIHSVGEPILWKELIPAISYLHEKGVRSWIFTSLVTKRKDILEALCLYCNIVEVSINSTGADDYLASKGVDEYELVKTNLEYMSQFIKDKNVNTRLVVSRVQSDSKEEDDKFVDYWKNTNLVADAFVRKYHNYNNLIEEKGECPTKKEPCLVHWMRFNIALDGTVVSCFNELFRNHLRDDVILGNVSKESIYDVWHNAKMNNLREAEMSGYEKGNFAEDFPCRNCFSCQSYDGKRETSEHQIGALQ